MAPRQNPPSLTVPLDKIMTMLREIVDPATIFEVELASEVLRQRLGTLEEILNEASSKAPKGMQRQVLLLLDLVMTGAAEGRIANSYSVLRSRWFVSTPWRQVNDVITERLGEAALERIKTTARAMLL